MLLLPLLLEDELADSLLLILLEAGDGHRLDMAGDGHSLELLLERVQAVSIDERADPHTLPGLLPAGRRGGRRNIAEEALGSRV